MVWKNLWYSKIETKKALYAQDIECVVWRKFKSFDVNLNHDFTVVWLSQGSFCKLDCYVSNNGWSSFRLEDLRLDFTIQHRMIRDKLLNQRCAKISDQ
jgi:hypothetical protein